MSFMDKMKIGVLTLAAAVSQLCNAGDMGPVASKNWTGVYLGGQLGEAWGYNDIKQDTQFGTRLGYRSDYDSSFIGGGYVGFNWQINQFLVGVEGDGNGVNLSKYGNCLYQSFGVGNPEPGSCFIPAYDFELQSPWQAAARARVGWIWAQTLFYVAGGVAFTEVKATYTTYDNYPPVGSQTFHDTYVGSTAGVGAEFKFNDHWVARAEYRYDNYGSTRHLVTQGGGFWDQYVVDHYLKDNSFRVGLSYLI